ncbi:MAG: TlpA family protein disulfide reductase [Planctomycetes bacterium]|nr:TlpA family protein disulfide reductase [Planctomycetota bacterium]
MRSEFCDCVLHILVTVSLLCAVSLGADAPKASVTPQGDPEWIEIPAAEAGVPPLTKSDLLKRVKEANAQSKSSDCWELRYRVKQISNPDGFFRNNRIDADIRLARSAGAWRYDVLHNDEPNARYSFEIYVAGGQVTQIFRQTKSVSLSRDVARACNYQPMHPLPPFLLPSIEAPQGMHPDQFTPGRLCDLIASLDSPKTKLLPWYTKVQGKTCYVLETTDRVTMPIFRDDGEMETWRQDNPAEWEKCRLGGVNPVINSSGTPGERSYAVTTHRIAVVPENSFRIARWTKGRSRGVGEQEWIGTFWENDVLYSYGGTLGQPDIPDEVLVTQYRSGNQNDSMQFLIETRLTVEGFSFAPDTNCFRPPTLPEGYSVIDLGAGIVYKVGDPPELIVKLNKLAAQRDAFYDRLSQMEQLPALKGASWINSGPLDLQEYRGRPVDLYFWSIGCGPCLIELPRIEEEFQRNRKIEGSPQIILIHGHVPESMVEKVKNVLDEKGVTAPCVIDAPFKGPTWGQICADFGVQSVPTRIRIGADGEVLNNERTLISAHNLKTSLFAPK